MSSRLCVETNTTKFVAAIVDIATADMHGVAAAAASQQAHDFVGIWLFWLVHEMLC